MLKAYFHTQCAVSTLFYPQSLPTCTDAIDSKGSAVSEVADTLPGRGSFAMRTMTVHPQIIRTARLWASRLPTGFLCLSSRRDHAHRLLRVCWWPVLVREAWHHGAGGKGFALGCHTLTHPGGHGGCHETFISSENCTYVEFTKICFLWWQCWPCTLQPWTVRKMVQCSLDHSVTHLGGIPPNCSNIKIIFNNIFKNL